MKKIDLLFALLLLPVDILMIVFAFICAYYARMDLEVLPAFSTTPIQEYLRFSFYLIPVWIVLMAINGMYAIRSNRSRIDELFRIFSSSSVAMLFLVIWFFFSHTFFFSRIILAFTWGFSVFTIFFGRQIIVSTQKTLLKYGVGSRNLLLIGDNNTSEEVCEYLSIHKELGYIVKGVLNLDGNSSKFGLKILGSINQLKEKIGPLGIDEVILTDINISKVKILEVIQICSDYKLVFKYMPDTLSLMSLNVSSELIGSMPVMELKPIPLDGWGRITKRVLDLTIAILLFLLTLPFTIIIAVLIKLSSKGPVFYSQPRIGRDGSIFNCHKFRTMYYDKCDFKGGTKWTTASDTRISAIGKILRKTNFDEIPQIWNILHGEMSFVGPRPEQPKLVKKFENEIPEYFKRHRVKAGLTGWAQVNGLKGDTSIKERVRYDIYYIEHWSFWLDIQILIKTIFLIINESIFGKTEYRPRT